MSLAFRVSLREEFAGNDPVLMTADERTADMQKHLAFARVGMQENLLLHVRIGRCGFMAFGAQECVWLVLQPEIDARTVFGTLDS